MVNSTTWRKILKSKNCRAVLVLACTLLSACDSDKHSADRNTPDEQLRWTSELISEINLSKALETSQSEAGQAAPEFPKDLTTQPTSRVSRLSLNATLSLADGDEVSSDPQVAAVMATLDRLSLGSAARLSGTDLTAASQWHYDDVLRSVVTSDAALAVQPTLAPDTLRDTLISPIRQLAFLNPTQQVQRAALGLAGSQATSIWVGNNRLTISPMASDALPCNAEYQWQAQLSESLRVRLQFSLSHCPSAQRLGAFFRWQLNAAAATGELIELVDAQPVRSTPINARVWFAHVWGNALPAEAGAVAIDTLVLELGKQHLEISRTKRRSGRGPKTVLATLYEKEREPRVIELQWEDSEELVEAASGTSYPQSIQLISTRESINVSVDIMNRRLESSVQNSINLTVPVIIEGSHSGTGFLNYVALDAASS